ncbi:MAG: 7TM diverse intracellular signaling domain-containing protein, partial [Pseudomonadota bacterium]
MQFAIKQHNDTWVTGLIYGVIAIMALYNFFILVVIRERLYLYYVLFTVTLLFSALINFGYGFQHLWPNTPHLNSFLALFIGNVSVIATLLLTQHFLDLPRQAKRLNFVVNIIIVLSAFSAVYSLFGPLNAQFGLLYIYLPLVFTLFVSWYCWFKRSPGAGYLVLAWTGFFASIFISLGVGLDVIPANALTRNIVSLGLIPLVVVISFGLAERLNKLRLAHLEAEKNLLQEAQAKQKIAEENLGLQKENMRMSTELDVTRQLQEMVLPTSDELSHIKQLDIACWMEPADEVGGDYYDVLQYNGKVIIGIGDVTGHGLASGVLMLMVQTAIRTLAISEVNDSRNFFHVLNQTVYDNVERMGIDKNLTLVLIDYQGGHLRISGQHEEILIVRKNGEMERIDTIDLGFMIGVERDIEALVNSIELSLQPGDGIVLYTDGITEAFSDNRKQYGLDRLCEVISENWAESSRDIQQAVIQDFHGHTGEARILDDYTFMVIKQL